MPERRIRETHFVDGAPPIVYDVERTFTFVLPPVEGAAFDAWAIGEDLLTTEERPRLSDALPAVTDISIDLSGACNLRCVYCFEEDIGSRLGPMSEETAAAALDFVFGAAPAESEITLHFGSGEPLLQFERLRRIVGEAEGRAGGRGQRIAFELTTNATLVTPAMTAFFARHNFHVHVSCDGPEHVHDANRPLAGGRPSYALVKRGLDLLLERRPRRGVTVNAVLAGGTRLGEIWEWAKALGVPRLIVIKVGAPLGEPVSLRAGELDLYRRDLAAIAADLAATLARGERPADFQPLTKVVRRLMLPEPVARYCHAGGSYLGVASDGSVFPCFRHLGIASWRLGDVRGGIDDVKRARFRGTNAAVVDRRPLCDSCWARYLCGGGCYADSTVYGPDPLQPQAQHCPFWRAEIEAGIRLFRRLIDDDPRHVLALLDAALPPEC